MSMDDQYRLMREFFNTLEEFNFHLEMSLKELEELYDAVDPLWEGEERDTYDREWNPLHDRAGDYLKRDGARYRQFLETKIRYLKRYLEGG